MDNFGDFSPEGSALVSILRVVSGHKEKRVIQGKRVGLLWAIG